MAGKGGSGARTPASGGRVLATPEERARARRRKKASAAAEERRWRRAQQRQRSVLGVILLAVVAVVGFGLLLGIHTLGGAVLPHGTAAGIYTSKVAVIGVTDRTAPTQTDNDVLKSGDHQAGAVLTQGRCPASGWATLSAGTEVEVSCDIEVTDLGVVDNWADRQAEAARTGGELGALAGAGAQCISAVGPGAALAAARSDGTVADYLDVDSFVAGKYRTSCPVTLVDAGDRTDEIVAALAAQDDWTVIVTGVGGRAEAQQIYRTQTTLPGWFTAASTGRTGIVTLADLSHTLRTVIAGEQADTDPGALQVVENGGVPPDRLAEHVEQTNRLVAVPAGPIGILAALVGLGALVAVGLWWQGRRPGPESDPNTGAVRSAVTALAVLAATFPAGLLAAGAVGWWRTGGPEASLVGSVVIIWLVVAAVVGAAARLIASRQATGAGLLQHWLFPAAVVVTFALFLGDAALGGFLHRSSLLAPRPMTDFHGFGGAAMGVLLTSGLAALGLVTAPWWRALAERVARDDTGAAAEKKERRAPLPYALLWRPITAVAVTVGLVLGMVWASRPPTAVDVVGFAVAVAWCGVTGLLLRRSTRATR